MKRERKIDADRKNAKKRMVPKTVTGNALSGAQEKQQVDVVTERNLRELQVELERLEEYQTTAVQALYLVQNRTWSESYVEQQTMSFLLNIISLGLGLPRDKVLLALASNQRLCGACSGWDTRLPYTTALCGLTVLTQTLRKHLYLPPGRDLPGLEDAINVMIAYLDRRLAVHREEINRRNIN